jgi:mRNA interferase MazF
MNEASSSKDLPMPPDPKRGEIWRINFYPTKGSEIEKQRPAVVISSNALGSLQPVKLVVPVTEWKPSREGRIWIVRIEPTKLNGLSKTCGADTAQIRAVTISPERFLEKVGVLEPGKVEEVAAALAALIEFQ